MPGAAHCWMIAQNLQIERSGKGQRMGGWSRQLNSRPAGPAAASRQTLGGYASFPAVKDTQRTAASGTLTSPSCCSAAISVGA